MKHGEKEETESKENIAGQKEMVIKESGKGEKGEEGQKTKKKANNTKKAQSKSGAKLSGTRSKKKGRTSRAGKARNFAGVPQSKMRSASRMCALFRPYSVLNAEQRRVAAVLRNRNSHDLLKDTGVNAGFDTILALIDAFNNQLRLCERGKGQD